MQWLMEPESWVAFLTLVSLELVLGIDNVVFISILASKLPQEQQARARTIGLSLAVVSRIILLASLSWIMGLTKPLIGGFTGKDFILITGGLFLVGKATHEIHQKLEGVAGHGSAKTKATFQSVIIQVLLLDIVFSLDSVITAVGMVDKISIMVTAVVVSAIAMIAAAGVISRFVEKHPTVKMLALSFLLLIGFTLIVDGFHHHIPKGYIYSAMGFSIFVEFLNMRLRKKRSPVRLHEPFVAEKPTEAVVE